MQQIFESIYRDSTIYFLRKITSDMKDFLGFNGLLPNVCVHLGYLAHDHAMVENYVQKYMQPCILHRLLTQRK